MLKEARPERRRVAGWGRDPKRPRACHPRQAVGVGGDISAMEPVDPPLVELLPARRWGREVRPSLARSPVENNLLLALADGDPPGLRRLRAQNELGIGLLLQADPNEALVRVSDPTLAEGLALALARGEPKLPGALGVGAGLFGAAWAQLRGGSSLEAGQVHLLELRDLPEAKAVPPGQARQARMGEALEMNAWVEGFLAEQGEVPGRDGVGWLARAAVAGALWIWDRGGAQGMAVLGAPVEGRVRLSWVYVPPAHRGRGIARALVAATSAQALVRPGIRGCVVLAEGDLAVSGGLYRSVGYKPAVVLDRVRFS